MAEADELIKKLQAHRGVTGIVILSTEGIPLRTTMDQETTVHITGLIQTLVQKSRAVIRELDSSNSLSFLRLRSKKYEIMCAAEQEYILVVIQSPTIAS